MNSSPAERDEVIPAPTLSVECRFLNRPLRMEYITRLQSGPDDTMVRRRRDGPYLPDVVVDDRFRSARGDM